MYAIGDLVIEKKGKLVSEFDFSAFKWVCTIRDSKEVAVLNATGDTLEEALGNLQSACVEYYSKEISNNWPN